jgi:hypothetical protein
MKLHARPKMGHPKTAQTKNNNEKKTTKKTSPWGTRTPVSTKVPGYVKKPKKKLYYVICSASTCQPPLDGPRDALQVPANVEISIRKFKPCSPFGSISVCVGVTHCRRTDRAGQTSISDSVHTGRGRRDVDTCTHDQTLSCATGCTTPIKALACKKKQQ